ncbi:hypothetical protein WME89_06405 [Sorangium sp. So ce321]|uniref:hypothetical protein n=1 Tax=Sorangium sp. So ce321 TaxID=3133300 RepID=UPI003F6297F9
MGLAAAGMAVSSGAATSFLLAAVLVTIVDRWYIAFEERRPRAALQGRRLQGTTR